MTNIINLEDIFKEKKLPKGLKLLKELPDEDSKAIIESIMEVIVMELHYWLGMADGDLEDPIFFNTINDVYKKFWGGCCFCDPDIEVERDSEICISCHRKIIKYLEIRERGMK